MYFLDIPDIPQTVVLVVKFREYPYQYCCKPHSEKKATKKFKNLPGCLKHLNLEESQNPVDNSILIRTGCLI